MDVVVNNASLVKDGIVTAEGYEPIIIYDMSIFEPVAETGEKKAGTFQQFTVTEATTDTEVFNSVRIVDNVPQVQESMVLTATEEAAV